MISARMKRLMFDLECDEVRVTLQDNHDRFWAVEVRFGNKWFELSRGKGTPREAFRAAFKSLKKSVVMSTVKDGER